MENTIGRGFRVHDKEGEGSLCQCDKEREWSVQKGG